MFVGIFLFVAAASAVVMWSYFPEFAVMAERWATEEEYSHGWLVPAFSIFLLSTRRELFGDSSASKNSKVSSTSLWIAWGLLGGGLVVWNYGALPDGLNQLGWAGMASTIAGFSWLVAAIVTHQERVPFAIRCWGLGLVVLAGVMRLLASLYNTEAVDHFSLIPTLAGLVLAVGGWTIFRWALPSLVYLVFMMPLPFTLETALRQPLRNFATTTSTYVLQTIGYPAYSEGNRVLVNEVQLDIVEACSGLSMLMVFFALSVAVAILSGRPLWQRVILVLSAVPIALASNVVRILTQGLLMIYGRNAEATWFHDYGAAWVMMGFALLLLWMELWYLDRVVIVEMAQPMDFGLGKRSPGSTTATQGSQAPAI